MPRLLAIMSLAEVLGLAAPAPGFMPAPPLDSTLDPMPDQACPPGLYWSYQFNQCVSMDRQSGPGQPAGCPRRDIYGSVSAVP